MRRRLAEVALLAAGLAVVAAAAPGEVRAPSPGPKAGPAASPAPGGSGSRVRLKGPFTITAQYSEGAVTGVTLFRGNVKLVSQDLEIRGDKLELRQTGKGQYEAHVTGSPAQMNHNRENGAPPISARASVMHYDTRTAIVDLTGSAELDRGADIMTGDAIRYDVNSRRISARGLNGGQIKLTVPQPLERAREAQDKRKEQDKDVSKPEKKP